MLASLAAVQKISYDDNAYPEHLSLLLPSAGVGVRISGS
jgi:hypothetical protein